MTPTPSRLVGAAALGWLVVYNLLRFAGGAAAEVWAVSLVIGGALGIAAFFATGFAASRSPRIAQMFDRRPAPTPALSALSEDQRGAIRVASLAIAALAAVAAAVGVVLAATLFFGEPEWQVTTIVLGGWFLFVGVWLADEYTQMVRGDVEGLDAAGVGCMITASLAAIGFARDISPAGQLVLIVLAGVAGFAAGYASWRLARRHRLPIGGIVAAAVAVVALVLAISA